MHTDTNQTLIETQRRHYRAALAGLTTQDWSQEQIRTLSARLQGQAPTQCVAAAKMLVAAQVNGGQAALLLEDTWGSLTELRHAISRCRRRPEHQPAAPIRPSHDALVAAEESCWAEFRAGRGQRPDSDLITARAFLLDMRQREAAAPTAQEPAAEPAQEKLSKARATLAEAERKVSEGKFTGRVEVEVRFLDLEGTEALVPSSTGGTYLVLLREGRAYRCGCKFNEIKGLHCKHMAAAEAAYRACDAQPGTVLKARALLVPRRMPRKPGAQAA